MRSLARTACAAALLAAGCAPAEPPPAPGPARPPNVLVLLADTTRADHMGFAGYARDTTPHLDRLAERSTVFLGHRAHASRTGPSVASLFTGLHPRSHGAVNPIDEPDGRAVLAHERVTLAEVLQAAGYDTGAFVTNPNVDGRFGYGQGFLTYAEVSPPTVESVNEQALGWLGRHAEPFLLYLHYLEPHSPYDAPLPFAGRFADPAYDGALSGTHEELDRVLAGALEPSAAERAHLVDRYDEEIAALDAGLGALLEALDERGLSERTIVVFVSDHGEEFLEHGGVLHGYTLYDEVLRVPLLIHDPRRPPRRVEAPTRMVDLFPTLLELVGVDAPEGLQGRSLVPLLDGDGRALGPAPLYAEASLSAVRTVRSEALVEDGWKLVRETLPAPRLSLYDLGADPGEQRDLAGAEPLRLERLRADMGALEDALPVGSTEVLRLEADERERLRALGYGGGG